MHLVGFTIEKVCIFLVFLTYKYMLLFFKKIYRLDCELHSSDLLRKQLWKFLTTPPNQPVGSIFKSKDWSLHRRKESEESSFLDSKSAGSSDNLTISLFVFQPVKLLDKNLRKLKVKIIVRRCTFSRFS